MLGRGGVWLDTGSIEDFYSASNFISTIENRQGFKIACIEEISLNNKWIKEKEIKNQISFYGNCEYSKYLNLCQEATLKPKIFYIYEHIIPHKT